MGTSWVGKFLIRCVTGGTNRVKWAMTVQEYQYCQECGQFQCWLLINKVGLSVWPPLGHSFLAHASEISVIAKWLEWPFGGLAACLSKNLDSFLAPTCNSPAIDNTAIMSTVEAPKLVSSMGAEGVNHKDFVAWAKQVRGVQIDGVEPASFPGAGIGIVANRKITVRRHLE